MIPAKWLAEADTRLDAHIRRTPLTYDAARDLYIKWENHQVTGSFKVRGALNKALTLLPWEREMGFVAASAGNHGQGVALAGKLLNAPVIVFAPQDAPLVKLDAIRELGAEVRLIRGGYHEAEKAGLTFAKENQSTWISPYNDGQVIAGQSTLATEVLRAEPKTAAATWLVPVSGGGLLAGFSSVLREQANPALRPRSAQARVIGLQAEASAFMRSLYYRGTQKGIPDLPTIADGLAGAVEKKSITIPLIKKNVDEIILLSEEEIERAVAFAWHEYGEKIEGSGAVGLAAILAGKATRRPAVAVVSGGNIQPEAHQEIIDRYEI